MRMVASTWSHLRKPFLSALTDLSHPMAPAEFFLILFVFPFFHLLIRLLWFLFISIAFCTVFPDFFSLFLQMPLIFASSTVSVSLSFYYCKTLLIALINDVSLTKLQGLFSILIRLNIFLVQANNCPFLFDMLFLLHISDFALTGALSCLFCFSFGGEVVIEPFTFLL